MPEKITLQEVQKKAKVKNFRASDFLSDEQMTEIRENNLRGSVRKQRFDEVDAFIAEVIARFGFETYQAWKAGDIEQEQMVRYIEAERSRTIREQLGIESVLVAAIAGANNATKNGHAPKSLKDAIKALKEQEKRAKGEY